MFKITDILSLGSEYTISDASGAVVGTIQVIPLTELLDATLGSYTEDFGGFANYIERSVATLSGFDQIDPNKVLWYATTEEEVALSDLIEYAVKHDYNKIILEHLDELE